MSGTIWAFKVVDRKVFIGEEIRRPAVTGGCNEPFMGRFWCPEKKWFRKTPCPFSSRYECLSFRWQCGCLD